MKLVVDIGNTLTKALVFGEDGPVGETMSGPSSTPFILEVLDAHRGFPTAIASVVRPEEELLTVIADRQLLSVDSHTPLPIVNRYATPETLGIDRICAAVGARSLFPANAVLAIDMGTCITYELVTGDGDYLGGAISPGMGMRFRALAEQTSRLPLLEPGMPESIIGYDTATSIRSGVQHGIRLEMDGAVDTYTAQFTGLRTVITGGDALLFAHALKSPIFADPILVLRGLHEILLYNL